MSIRNQTDDLKTFIREEGLKLFDQVGFAQAVTPPTIGHYSDWLNEGLHGEMSYLARHLEKKMNPQLLLEGAASWIVFILNYDTQEPLSIELQEEFRRDKKGWIARYARGRDYHLEIKSRHDQLILCLQNRFPGEKFLGCVDTKAVLERDAAHQAGLGWIGKNTCLINKDIGSFIFISEILTTLALEPDKPVMDHCGTCTRCLDACPTGALVQPRLLDATKCISYWTIESKVSPDPSVASLFGANVFGCDICQDVCPWNKKARRSKYGFLDPFFESGSLGLEDILSQNDDNIKLMLHKKSMDRVKPARLRENARIALSNLKSHD